MGGIFGERAVGEREKERASKKTKKEMYQGLWNSWVSVVSL